MANARACSEQMRQTINKIISGVKLYTVRQEKLVHDKITRGDAAAVPTDPVLVGGQSNAFSCDECYLARFDSTPSNSNERIWRSKIISLSGASVGLLGYAQRV